MDDDLGDDVDFNEIILPEEKAPHSSAPSVSAPPADLVASPSKVDQPKPQVLPARAALSTILVSARQKGNPILNHIKLMAWEYADIPADYVLGATTCALFLSLKYHRLHPEYVYNRIRLLAGKYNLRILLIMVDISNHEDTLKELSKTSIVNNVTLILCWSAPEAAHYLELFKSSENAQPTAIRAQQAQSYKESLLEFVTAPRSINKSDAASLISTFGSLQGAIDAQPEQITSIPGWGEKKVAQWCKAVREDFRVEKAKKRPAADQERRIEAIQDGRDLQSLDNVDKYRRSPIEGDEDEAMLLAVAQEVSQSEGETATESRPNRSRDLDSSDGMNEGIMAALAKFREQGDKT
ncbi:hypothetical protein Egran_07005 [Elaphomyces granulatus]|uniref:ERCC1-like central domain-containing protein n=1 Tax=Elaphomyces granulatus TaxID=519963 RepID=A0A232LM52_9EURO|nr:hypothetical protein Egran_07005 [Elaphomyces granulatus]